MSANKIEKFLKEAEEGVYEPSESVKLVNYSGCFKARRDGKRWSKKEGRRDNAIRGRFMVLEKD